MNNINGSQSVIIKHAKFRTLAKKGLKGGNKIKKEKKRNISTEKTLFRERERDRERQRE